MVYGLLQLSFDVGEPSHLGHVEEVRGIDVAASLLAATSFLAASYWAVRFAMVSTVDTAALSSAMSRCARLSWTSSSVLRMTTGALS